LNFNMLFNWFSGKKNVETDPVPVLPELTPAGLMVEAQSDREEIFDDVNASEIIESSTVCYCFDVDEQTIKAAINAENLCSIEEVGECLNAGTHCGSCWEKIELLLSAKDA
jgi:NAD(P)H-nitrite reductase large subunit